MAADREVEHPLWRRFDKVRSALYKQEQQRRFGPLSFGRWLERALPYYVAHVEAIHEAEEHNYSDTLCAWFDWADKRGLAWRGALRDHFQRLLSVEAPLTFVPPSDAGLMRKAASLIVELKLGDAVRRSARYGAAPTEGTRGGSGRKTRSQFTVRKPSG